MRVISGTLKGRNLFTPGKGLLRPTSDRVKESMFNILGKDVEDKVVLDLFAGTGNLGIEALSRGAVRAVFVEKNREAFRLIERNLVHCHAMDRSEILLKEVDRALNYLAKEERSFDLIFMDPPYEKGLIRKTMEVLTAQPIYRQDSIVVIEHDRREPLPDLSGSWGLIRQQRIGDTVLSFLTPSIHQAKVSPPSEVFSPKETRHDSPLTLRQAQRERLIASSLRRSRSFVVSLSNHGRTCNATSDAGEFIRSWKN